MGKDLQLVIIFLMIQLSLSFLTFRERQPTSAGSFDWKTGIRSHENRVCIGGLGKKEGPPGARSRLTLDELEKTIAERL